MSKNTLIPSSVTRLFFVLIFIAFQISLSQTTSIPIERWIGTWSTSEQLVEPNNMPPKPGLTGNTLRQIVRVSLGGERVRVKFSNEFSKSPVTLKTVHIAVSTGNGAIDPGTEKELLFDGKPEVTMPPGFAVTSDPIDFVLKPRSDAAITIYFGDTSPDVTGHPGSRTTSFLFAGNEVSKADSSGAVTADHWYVINGIDVVKTDSSAAVVVLGNSITDGRGSGTNKQNRWTDELARRLQANPGTEHVAVLNEGIGGNCVLKNCLGPSALSRFERDVLNQKGVRWLIILEGINDVGQVHSPEAATNVATGLIAAYETMIDSAHAKGIRVYGATLLPFRGSFYDSPNSESAGKTVNEWIRSSGRFDAVVDFEAALNDPANPMHLLPGADTGDHLHPNETGHRMLGEAVDLKLFQ
jgi:lysophospholipase L1-like esterase